MIDLNRLSAVADRAARRRDEIAALTCPTFVTDPRDVVWRVDYDTGLAHLYTDIYFLDSRANLWAAPSCGCSAVFCQRERGRLAGLYQQSGTGKPSDGSSIPRLAWIVTGSPLEPENAIAGFLHDAAYRTAALAGGESITRRDADRMYREVCPFHPDIPREEAALRYYALRAVAWWPWLKHRYNEKREVANG